MVRNHGKESDAPAPEGSLEQRAYAALRDALIQGGFPPGEKLSIRRIAVALGVSPMPARAALRRLAAERCLDIAPGGAAIVPLITRAEYREITRIRCLLEPEAAATAVPRLTGEEIAVLRAIAAEAKAARSSGDEETYRRGDRLLHQRFFAAAGQPLLLSLIETLWMRRSAIIAQARPLLPARPDKDDHDALIAAAETRDPAAAAEASRSEIERAAAYLMTRLRFPDDPAEPVDGWTTLRRING
ncbi:GntR family transcriptional regulator [Neoroseomonas soli]|uniref:GntR family transcriptional regulator n=1 Tax=Neoroseomonas soli TaxID=1081025 RepID=A0A9X9X0A7_9PROT|nr:GntR family transcriptional regulator [Neoroseomonas soli]MBR0672836.1 GntR family transcriptional regulator [Neoroseomonas soli]